MRAYVALVCFIQTVLSVSMLNSACPKAFQPGRPGAFRGAHEAQQGCCTLALSASTVIFADAALQCGQGNDETGQASRRLARDDHAVWSAPPRGGAMPASPCPGRTAKERARCKTAEFFAASLSNRENAALGAATVQNKQGTTLPPPTVTSAPFQDQMQKQQADADVKIGPEFYNTLLTLPSNLMPDVTPDAQVRARSGLCNLNRVHSWQVGNCCSKPPLRSRTQALRRCTKKYGGTTFQHCVKKVEHRWKQFLHGAVSRENRPRDMRRELHNCHSAWRNCIRGANGIEDSRKCESEFSAAHKGFDAFKHQLLRCLWHKEQLDLARIDPAMWEAEVNLEHCEHSARWQTAAQKCRRAARTEYRAALSSALAKHPACVRYGKGMQGALLQLDTKCLPHEARTDIDKKRHQALQQRKHCEMKIASCFGRDEAEIARDHTADMLQNPGSSRWHGVNVEQYDTVLQHSEMATRKACVAAVDEGLSATRLGVRIAVKLYSKHPELMTTEANRVVNELSFIKLPSMERMLAVHKAPAWSARAAAMKLDAQPLCRGDHPLCQLARMSLSTKLSKTQCEANEMNGCMWDDPREGLTTLPPTSTTVPLPITTWRPGRCIDKDRQPCRVVPLGRTWQQVVVTQDWVDVSTEANCEDHKQTRGLCTWIGHRTPRPTPAPTPPTPAPTLYDRAYSVETDPKLKGLVAKLPQHLHDHTDDDGIASDEAEQEEQEEEGVTEEQLPNR